MTATSLNDRFRQALPSGTSWASLRMVHEETETLSVRRGVVAPVGTLVDHGVMITIRVGDGVGYASTNDLSASGLAAAAREAAGWAREVAGRMTWKPSEVQMPVSKGSYRSPVERSWHDVPLADRISLLERAAAAANLDDRVVSWTSSVMAVDTEVRLLTSDGGDSHQHLHHLSPEVEVYAHADGVTQRRTLGGLRGASQQGGSEILDRFGFEASAARVAREALELLEAQPCPTGELDLLLAPDQMMLQIHESIGHPIELDRILGDERNYAGTSFVTLDMFGSYQYGSSLLDVTFDPTLPEQMASYRFDDDGSEASKVWLIKDGVLVRPLGGAISGARAGMPSVANSRASSWNRPPIDRMANLNVEPGVSSLDELIGSVERGVYMQTNRSWSIDDSRNKFQFGCEYGRLIVDGKLGGVVRDPNYRGISSSFWRSLVGVGDRSTFEVLGTPYCGKGEPNQVIRVGHASPACLFRGVSVFGGAA